MSHEHSPYLHPQRLEAPRVLPELLPTELREVPQWICWRYMTRGPDQKPDKQPVNPWNLHNAGVHWPNTWSTFAHAYMTYVMYQRRGLDGIGFVLTPNDSIVGWDMDNCLQGEFIRAEAHAVITQLASYTEVSPSGQGLRVLVKNAEFGRNVRTPGLEVYSHSRFLTLTGRHFPSTPREIREVTQDELARVLPSLSSQPQSSLPSATAAISPLIDGRKDIPNAHAPMPPDHLWERIFQHDRYGEDHRQRFLGNTSLDRSDHSMTVIRLLNTLARWTNGHAATMRQMMLMSPLANEKWFSKRGKGDWLDHQIEDAIAFIQRGK